MAGYQVKPLDKETWPDFASLVERHNGVWGGCWCLEFHPEGSQKGVDRRALKEQRVNENRAHAALVFDGDLCIGWCQFGSPDELPRIKFGRAYGEAAAEPPEWRITCFFVDKAYRHKGVAAAALKGALSEIARLGGGTVESSPDDVEGRKVSNSFLYNANLAMFEKQGFERTRQLGKNSWLVTKEVLPTNTSS
ncbi:MAG TPA: GNAT family N-acetyltransferase [Acidimicrobiia bacterium]